jgi:hypothetical protein
MEMHASRATHTQRARRQTRGANYGVSILSARPLPAPSQRLACIANAPTGQPLLHRLHSFRISKRTVTRMLEFINVSGAREARPAPPVAYLRGADGFIACERESERARSVRRRSLQYGMAFTLSRRGCNSAQGQVILWHRAFI